MLLASTENFRISSNYIRKFRFRYNYLSENEKKFSRFCAPHTVRGTSHPMFLRTKQKIFLHVPTVRFTPLVTSSKNFFTVYFTRKFCPIQLRVPWTLHTYGRVHDTTGTGSMIFSKKNHERGVT